MRPTRYFPQGTAMTEFADKFRQENKKDHWTVRTALRCDHVINEKRNAILLISNETVVQRLIGCKDCFEAQKNRRDIIKTVEPENNAS